MSNNLAIRAVTEEERDPSLIPSFAWRDSKPYLQPLKKLPCPTLPPWFCQVTVGETSIIPPDKAVALCRKRFIRLQKEQELEHDPDPDLELG